MRVPKPLANSFSKLLLLILLIFTVFSVQYSYAQQLAFPSAKGAGAYTTGGRGGQVIHVTTLDWNAPGGLREAIQTEGPRIIVFDVSGEIDATSEGDYTPIINGSQYNDITIAGQSAPAGGITIRTSEFMFQNVSNVVIRYIRFRNDVGSIQDAFWFTGGSNIIVDHCSFSHGGDESASLGSSVGVMGDITMQNCFLQDSKTGTILGVDDVDGDFTFVNNLYSSVSHRFPNPKGDGQYDIINNIVYNWKYRLVRITGEGTYNVVNNYYKPSAGGLRQPGWFGNGEINFLQKLQTNANDNPLIYTSGNIITGQRETPLADDRDMWTVFAGSHLPQGLQVPDQYFTNTQFQLAGQGYAVAQANQAYIDVLNNVGADKTLNADGSIHPFRDDKDASDILMIQNDSYNGSFFGNRADIPYPTVPQSVRPDGFDSNNDGMPDIWKAARGFGMNDDISNLVWPSGYVGVEEYLNEIDLNSIDYVEATGVEVTPETATINIPETVDLASIVFPIDASNQSGSWSSSNTSIATVGVNGVVTPVSEGEVTITFTTNDGGFTDEALITVTNIVIPLESISVTPETATLDLSSNLQLSTAFFPLNTTDISGTWSSSDNSVVTVNSNGYITTQNEGEAEITFTSNDGGLTDSAIITVVDDYYGTYFLYNADSNQIIHDIVGDASINLGTESSQINFRSIPEGGDENVAVESVRVIWSGPSSGVWVESDPLYAGLPGGHVGLNFEPYTVEEGVYNFTVIYYTDNAATGNVIAVDKFELSFFFSTLPIANAGPDQEICEGETTTLTASGGPNFLWNNGETTASIEVNPLTTTTYSVVVSDDLGNTSEDTVDVTVNPLPLGDAGLDQTICAGETITLTATGGISYLWSTGETTPTIEVAPTTETIYNVEVFSINCSSTDSVTIFTNDAPDITLTSDVVIVDGESTTLVAEGSDNYLWSTGETSSFINVTPTVTTTYSVSSIGLNGCSKELDVIVTVIPEVVADAGNDSTICRDETVTLNATGGGTYLWNTGETTAQILVTPMVTTTYSVIVEDDYGYTDSDTVTVTVNETPQITVSDDVVIIEGQSTTLIATGGDNYQWNTGDTTATIDVTPLSTTTYTVISTAVGGCADIEQVIVTVIPEVIADAGEDVTICSGEIVTLTATGGGTYRWNTDETNAQITVTPLVTTTYTVTVEDDYGYSDSDSITITVNETPDITVSEDVIIEDGQSITLIANGGNNYQWGTGETTSNISVSPSTTTTYSVTSTSLSGNCTDTEQVTVTVVPEVIADAGEDATICSGESITLSASGGITYSWNTGDTGATPIVSPIVTTTYSVTVEDAYGFSDTDSVTITVNAAANISVSADIVLIEGESATLSATGGDNYLWSTGETTASVSVSPMVTTTYTVSSLGEGGCDDIEEITVTVEPLFQVSAGADERVCDSSTYEVILTATQGDSYLWNTGATSQSIVVSPVATSTYIVTVTNGSQQDTDDVTVYVDPNPEVIIANGDSVDIMNGDFVTLSATGANTYLWDNGATQPNIAVSPSVTTTYEVRGFIGDCYDEKQIVVNVIPEVEANAGEDVIICLDDSTILTAIGGDEYVWSTGETTQSILVSPNETTEYTVTVFNALDFDEDSVIVEVNTNCEEEEIPGDGTYTFDVFPNPANNVVNIRLSGSDLLTKVYLYDITGKLIYKDKFSNETIETTTTKEIDISNLTSGLYYIRLVDVNREVSKRLIVN